MMPGNRNSETRRNCTSFPIDMTLVYLHPYFDELIIWAFISEHKTFSILSELTKISLYQNCTHMVGTTTTFMFFLLTFFQYKQSL